MNDAYILILYYSRHGSVRALAEQIALGVESTGLSAMLRTVPPVTTTIEVQDKPIPDHGDLYVSMDDVKQCAGLALGSPTRFGNMAAPLKYFLDTTSEIWLNGDLIDKPASVFTSTSSLHGGQESTQLNMMLPLLHQGMVISGIPYSEEDLHTTTTGGTPYGVSHVTFGDNTAPLSKAEQQLAQYQGKRLAQLAQKLLA